MIKGVIFDYDGTLSNRFISAYKTYRSFLKEYFPDKPDFEIESMTQNFMLYESNGILGVIKTAKIFAGEYKISEEIAPVMLEYYNNNIAKHQVLRPEAIEVLKELRKDYKLSILTNGNSKVQNEKIDFVGIRDYFDVVLPTGDIGYNKPDRRAYDAIIEKMSLQPEECVYVGDMFSGDIYGSTMAGIKAIWYRSDPSKPYTYDGVVIDNLHDLKDVLKSL